MISSPTFEFAPRTPGKIHRLYFGAVNVGGRIYEQDRLLTPQGVLPWWRPHRHYFGVEEFLSLYEEYKPEILLLGTGWLGMMEVDRRVRQRAHRRKLELFVDRTPRIAELYNSLRHWKKEGVIAALHLTC